MSSSGEAELNWEVCQDAIAAALRAFPLVRLAIRDGWCGDETVERVEDLIDEFLDWVSAKDYEVPDIADHLRATFESMLHCISDQEDIYALANQLYLLLETTAAGKLDDARRLIELHIALDPNHGVDDDDDDDHDHHEHSAAAASSQPQPSSDDAAPEEDDGWITVSTKKRGGKR